MLGFKIKWDFCTYIMAHCLHTDILLRAEDKDKGTSLSLKELCKFYYNELYGYEDELEKEKIKVIEGNFLNLNGEYIRHNEEKLAKVIIDNYNFYIRF